MPRPNQPRTMQNEANLAERIKHERKARQWTYKEVAARMTAAGCAMQASAVQKIEATDRQPRKISVDELVAFASVFDTDVPGLLMPVAVVEEKEAASLLDALFVADSRLAAATRETLDALVAIAQAAEDKPGVAAFLSSQLDGLERVAPPPDPFGPATDDAKVVARATVGKLTSIAREHVAQMTQGGE